MISLVMMDFDGVIAQTEAVSLRHRLSVLDRYGIHYTKRQAGWLMGGNFQTREAIFRREFGSQSGCTEEVIRKILNEKGPRVDTKDVETPHLRVLLAGLKQRQIPVCVCTNSDAERVYSELNHMGIRDYFHSAYGAARLGPGKPDPYVYQTCLQAMHTEAKQAMVIEDSPAGIEAGKRAGVFVAALKDPDGIADQSGADVILTDISQALDYLGDQGGKML
jgi:HAD superfamily hydrolase (TIGR01509 family)